MNQQTSFLRNTSDRSARVFFVVGVCVHIVFLVSLGLKFLNPLYDDATHRHGQGADFFALYQASQNVVEGVSMYAKQPETVVVPRFYPYRYLPLPALTIGQVFRLVPPHVAYTIWILVQEILLFANLRLILRLFSDKRTAMFAMSAWLIFTPYYIELYFGQFDFLIATLLLWMIYYHVKGVRRQRDTMWIVSVLVKSHTLLLVPVYAKLKQWKSIAVMVALLLAGSVPYFLLMPGTFEGFGWNVTVPLSAQEIAGNQGFAALIGATILRLSGTWVSYINQFSDGLEAMNNVMTVPLIAWSVLIISASVFITMRTSTNHIVELFLLWILSYFLIYKHVWEAQYVMMLPVFTLLWWRMLEEDKSVRIDWRIQLTSYILIALPTVFVFIDQKNILVDPEFYWSTAESLIYHLAKPAGVLLLYVALAAALLRQRNLSPIMGAIE